MYSYVVFQDNEGEAPGTRNRLGDVFELLSVILQRRQRPQRLVQQQPPPADEHTSIDQFFANENNSWNPILIVAQLHKTFSSSSSRTNSRSQRGPSYRRWPRPRQSSSSRTKPPWSRFSIRKCLSSRSIHGNHRTLRNRLNLPRSNENTPSHHQTKSNTQIIFFLITSPKYYNLLIKLI